MKTLNAILLSLLVIPIIPIQKGSNPNLIVINLAESFSKQDEIPVSRVVDKPSFVLLETNPQALVAEGAKYEVTKDYIIVRQSGAKRQWQILLFDRKSGKFIREIGKQGRGPGEFSIYSPVPYNPGKKELYGISFAGELLAYDLEGNNTGKIKIPQWSDTKIPVSQNTKSNIDYQRILITADNMLDDSIFAGYVINSSGWEPRKMALFSKSSVLKVFPNNLTYKKENFNAPGMPPPGGFAKFFKWDNKLNFIEAFCDTLYQVTKESLIPRYFFNWGEYNAPYSQQAESLMTLMNNYFFIADIDETKNYFFLRLTYQDNYYRAFVDKRNNKVTFCKKLISGNSAFTDDLSGLMEIVPVEFTETNEMVYIIQPPKLFRWFNENPEKATAAKNKFPWLKDMDELSNPVIAIGKCKE